MEGGREAHFNYGKYSIYPSNHFETHLKPFVDGAFKLKGGTGKASAVMPYYTISFGTDPSGENVGNSFSRYMITELLPMQFPADMKAVEQQMEDALHDMRCLTDSDGNTYDSAFGLDWSGVIDDERVRKYAR